MKSWYGQRVDDPNVANAWKHLHSVLFKKVRVPPAGDIWRQSGQHPSGDDPEEGVQMIVSVEYVAFQVKSVIERREQWLRANSLPLNTIMNEQQKEAFLDELKAEYHGSDDQRRRQANDKEKGGNKAVRAGKKQRWSRECQRRGGTTQMFHLLSFSGRWDPDFFNNLPALQQEGDSARGFTRAALYNSTPPNLDEEWA